RRATIAQERIRLRCTLSDFLTETIGPLKDDQEKARVMMVLGANRDSYWDSVKLLEQVRRAIRIFERTHPGCVGIFAFDNATSHKAFSEDALVASKMNLGPGGLAPKMRETVWSGGRQSMIIEEDYLIYDKKKKTYVNLCGQPKGIQQVLSERGLWRDDMLLECTS
ncbi:2244_t:CDS:2, partial [Gigaspora margarita]